MGPETFPLHPCPQPHPEEPPALPFVSRGGLGGMQDPLSVPSPRQHLRFLTLPPASLSKREVAHVLQKGGCDNIFGGTSATYTPLHPPKDAA